MAPARTVVLVVEERIILRKQEVVATHQTHHHLKEITAVQELERQIIDVVVAVAHLPLVLLV